MWKINGQYRQIGEGVTCRKMKIKKIRKNFREQFFCSKAKIFRKKILQKSRNDSVAVCANKGGVGIEIQARVNTRTKRTCRVYIIRRGRHDKRV